MLRLLVTNTRERKEKKINAPHIFPSLFIDKKKKISFSFGKKQTVHIQTDPWLNAWNPCCYGKFQLQIHLINTSKYFLVTNTSHKCAKIKMLAKLSFQLLGNNQISYRCYKNPPVLSTFLSHKSICKDWTSWFTSKLHETLLILPCFILKQTTVYSPSNIFIFCTSALHHPCIDPTPSIEYYWTDLLGLWVCLFVFNS